MKQAQSICIALAIGSLVAACGGESASGDGGSSPSDAPEASANELGPMVTLAKVRVGTTTVEFMASGEGPDALVMLAVGGTGESPDPVSLLMQEHGGDLTSLELFLGMLPDVEPPPVLVATHPSEARAMGRSDDSVVHVGPLAGVIVEI